MDQLPSDLVDHLAHFLSRKDLRTIARAAVGKRELNNWAVVAEDHQEERYLLDVDICLPLRNSNEQQKILLSVRKQLFNAEGSEQWDFKKRNFAWIRSVIISPNSLTDGHRPCNFEEVVRVLSIPVVPREDGRSELTLRALNAPLMELALKMVNAAGKTFTALEFISCRNGVDLRVEEFVNDYLGKEASLQRLVINCTSLNKGRIFVSLLSLFNSKRRRSLRVCLPRSPFNVREISAFVQDWLKSDGAFEKKGIHWRNLGTILGWEDIKKEYNPVAGYIMHPTRNSSLELDYDHFRIVKLEHQHLPVTADWIHALITKWKQGNGLRLHRETKKMNVVLTSEDEWHKLEQICGAAVKHRRSTILSVEHVLEHRSLELEMQDGRQFTEIQIQHKSITLEKLEALVAEWRAGDSGTVVEGLRKIDVYISKPVWKKFTGTDVDRPILSHELIYSSQEQYVLDRLYADEADRFIVHHPRVNGRLIFKSLKHSSPKGFYLISSVPVDPMDVEDWNLALLFGSLEI
ncbi:hypothetical protein QR680_012084 [Steinernema hermaphroditum]|uniref:Uncharacterized protein n=1 Tax=Steinernema hermaphroditum TaxID=289476 RepID=A0AA39I3D0_9BILA|nr:hypothetical protein QR680_012084 [Steinernema hermaphroditum]